MAKRQKTQEESTPQVVEQPKVETPVMEKPQPVKIRKADLGGKKVDNWEIKSRTYKIKSSSPLTYTIRNHGLTWFDEEKGYAREVLATENQRTVFVDEMVGDYRPMHIIFQNGYLFVPKEKVMLQKLLSLYHPYLNNIYEEMKPKVVAANDLDVMDMEIDALLAARDMDIDLAEAIMRVEIGSKVSSMTSKELKRDLLIFAKNNPTTFISLANDDSVQLRNKGVKAVEQGLISLSADQRTFTWTTNGRKLMNVPFDEHPYNALAAWFKTDEGMEVYSNIEKRLK